MINKILLLSKNDIPFEQAQLIIHQPTLKEIAYIGQDAFFTGCEYLNFSKDKLNEEDKNHLGNLSDFEILMTIMKDKSIAVQKNKTCMQFVLLLLFPDYTINFLPMSIMLSKQTDAGLEQHLIDKDNFESFRNIVSEMFCLNQTHGNTNKYNPGGPQAQALVKKFKQREKKLAKLKNNGKQTTEISILSQYISILAVGQQKDMNKLLQYSVYQLFNEVNRFYLFSFT